MKPPLAAPGLVAELWSRADRWRGKGLREIVSNSGWVILEKVVRAVIAVVVTAWIARYLGPENYGSIAYGLAICAFMAPIAQLGIGNVVLRDLVRQPERAPEALGTCLALRAISGVVAVGAGVVFVLISVRETEARIAAILIIAQLAFQLFDTFELWFQSRLESRYGAVSRMLVGLTMAAVRVGLILTGMPLWTFALALLMEIALTSLVVFLVFRRHPNAIGWNYSRSRAGPLLREGFPFMLSALAIATYMRVDQVLVHHLAGKEVLGQYAAVVALSQVWQMVPVSLATSLSPVLARARNQGEDAYLATVRAMFVVFGLIGLGLALGIAVFAGLAVKLLLGPAYASVVPSLQIYGFTNIAVATGTAWGIWATTSGKGHLLLLNTVAGGFVSIVLNLLLIPPYGAIGAAIAANASFFTSALLVNFITCRPIFTLQLGWPYRRSD